MSVTKITLQNYADEVSRSEKPVLIDFYADWCGPCKMTAPELEAFSQEYDDVKVCKINVDESADLAATWVAAKRLISERFAIKICRVVIFTGICYDKNQ